jgi:hypothetical protein
MGRENCGRKPKHWTLSDILDNTRKEDDCLIWRGGTHAQGYGMMRYETEMRTVHSVIAEIKYGVKPTKYTGTRVTRTCGNLLCCNPDHIIIVDAGSLQRGNAADRGRFTDEEIIEIRRQYDNEHYHGLVGKLAKDYDVTVNHMSSICTRRIYKKVSK